MQLLCFIWNTTNCHLFVHSFNNVLRILFAKNELSLLVPLYTYLYLNKTISDKELSVVSYQPGEQLQWAWGTVTNKAFHVSNNDEYIN